jgi:hypothetical protein
MAQYWGFLCVTDGKSAPTVSSIIYMELPLKAINVILRASSSTVSFKTNETLLEQFIL